MYVSFVVYYTMKKIGLVLYVFLLCHALSKEADFVRYMTSSDDPQMATENVDPDFKNVVMLNDNNFSSFVAAKEPTLVMFYAPWCGHCKNMKPDYSKAATEMKAENINARLAALDCTANPSISKQQEISGYPTLKLFVNGKFISDYRGGRNAADIKAFMKNPPTFKKDEL